ncbi:MAG: hypothetical protein PHD82_16965 [Candidatus Riflebacteria bacterium]|nr:hypothetical protein [Candidatus Riflebacteria bacterium]
MVHSDKRSMHGFTTYRLDQFSQSTILVEGWSLSEVEGSAGYHIDLACGASAGSLSS